MEALRMKNGEEVEWGWFEGLGKETRWKEGGDGGADFPTVRVHRGSRGLQGVQVSVQ